VTRLSRILTGIGALLLAALQAAPLWTIQLFAPQYPEGLGMTIRLTTIEGNRPNDLDTINQLNHYIGMKAIEPGAIPELRYFPLVVAVLMVLGLTAAVLGKRRVVMAWLGGLALFGAAGLADFWRWAYDYGHHIDVEHAIIKIPGMTYQPPLIGTKQLLNFTATSWPASGAWLALAAFALGVIALRLSSSPAIPRSAALVGMTRKAAAFLGMAGGVAALVTVTTFSAGAQPPIIVRPHGEVPTIAAAIRIAQPGAVIRVQPGVYHEPTIVVDKPVTIVGDDWPVLDGEGTHQIMTVRADDVTVRGLVFRDVGTSFVEDRAALAVTKARGCIIENNRVERGFFGIYLAGATHCRIAGNVITGAASTEGASGNGIHLWSSDHITIEGNRVSRHRDGIYFEFVRESTIRGNTSERNLRYGLHFMYSDDCTYEQNTFRANGAGVAVMYTKRVTMRGNQFDANWGSAAYGLLLKEVYDVRLDRNRFHRNTVGLVADGANRIDATHNDFEANGWALRLMASTDGGRFAANNFVGNTFDVASNSRESSTELAGNYWDAYRGYDVGHDGTGDVPFHPVRLFSLLVQANAPSMILLRSAVVTLIDAAERALPTLTPATLVDRTPAMRRIR
jgi:nitrous oxidase accessory protein